MPDKVWLVALETDYEGQSGVRGFINEEAAMAYAQYLSLTHEAPLLVRDLATVDDVHRWYATSKGSRVEVWSDDGTLELLS